MNQQLKEKLSSLPGSPGVYFHKNKNSQIIYVGKAANLKNRVRQYFHSSRLFDLKTKALVADINDVDWQVVDSEAEALFLEAELIRRYQPKYNILLRDDKSLSYVRINTKDQYPSVTITRRPLDDGAEYYGPFLSSLPVRKSLKYLRKIFPYSTHITLPNRGCLQTHLNLCPGPETESYDRTAYVANLKKLSWYLKGEKHKVVTELEKEMKKAATDQDFERAAKLRNQLQALKALQVQIIFSDKESLDLSKDHALVELVELLGLLEPPKRIEGFDISHMSGTDNVASMVVFSNGVSQKSAYRKFKMNLKGNDDFAHMAEVIRRRFTPKNIKLWGKPDLILIDGGKGQLSAAIKARDESGQNVPMIGLAKKQEQIVISKLESNVLINDKVLERMNGYTSDESTDFVRINLPSSSHLIKLLQRIRDESHRFAVSYHSVLKTKRQTASLLDNIPSIGSISKRQLLKHFGSYQKIAQASFEELSTVVGKKRAKVLKLYLKQGQD